MKAEELEKQVTDLLWRGKPSEAAGLLDKAEKQASQRIAELEAQLQDAIEVRESIQRLRPSGDISVLHDVPANVPKRDPSRRRIRIPNKSSRSTIDKDKRGSEILRIADDMASASITSDVLVENVVEKAKSAGIDLGVQENREKTAVSNILKRSGGYERIGAGIYRAPRKGEGSADGGPSEPSNSPASANGAH